MSLTWIAIACACAYAAYRLLDIGPSAGVVQSRRDDARVLAGVCHQRGFFLVEEALSDFAEGEDLSLERVRSALRRLVDADQAAAVVLPVWERNAALILNSERNRAVAAAAFLDAGWKLEKVEK